MNDELKKLIEKDAKSRQGFSLAAGLMDQGGGIFKDASLVPRLKQVQMELVEFLRKNCSDSSGALHALLEQKIKENDAVLANHLDHPLLALKQIIQAILYTEDSLVHFVRAVDQKYGELYGERPYFQSKGQEAHPEDEYTHACVRERLEKLLTVLGNVVGNNG